MQRQLDTLERQECLEMSIKEMDSINKKMAKLIVKKEELTKLLIGALGHEHEGQRTYEYGMWKVEVKTPCVYSLNKKLYESGEIRIPDEYNPIKQSISYSIDKNMCDDVMQNAPKKIRDAISDLIDKKPSKPSITIKARSA